MDNPDQSLLDSLLNDPSFASWAKNTHKEDVALWNQWIQDHPEHLNTVYTAKAILLGIQFKENTVGDDELEHTFGHILESLQIENGGERLVKTRRHSLMLIGSLLICVLLASFYYFGKEKSSLIHHKTEYGMIMDLTLPDGTSVTLNGNSRISYDKGNPRDISLEGEAYFNVKKIPSTNAKFWVTTNDLRIAVYGTQFHV
ncbi:MAG: FecR domain-containing protein, partial [Flavobacteriaceae bacterium]